MKTKAWVTPEQFSEIRKLAQTEDMIGEAKALTAYSGILALLALDGRLENPLIVQMIGGPIRPEVELIVGDPPAVPL